MMADETMTAGSEGGGAPQTMGLMARVLGIFTSPAKTFADIQKKPAWFQPWLVLVVCSLIYTTSVGAKIGWEHVQQSQMKFMSKAQLEQFEKMPADQQARQLSVGLVITKVLSYGFPVLGLIGAFIAAGVYMMLFNFGAGAQLRYMECLSIVIFSDLPGIVRALLGTLVVWMGVDPESFLIQMPIPSNPAWFLNFDETPRFLYQLAASLDVIKIWAIVVMAIGFSVFTRKSRSTAMILSFLPWVLLVLIGAALGSLRS
jgi:hypothetical protein